MSNKNPKKQPRPVYTEGKIGNERTIMDVESRLLTDFIIIIDGEINDETSTSIINQLICLNSINKSKEISIYIKSPGGSVTDGLAILDTMEFISNPIHTIALGMVASMASILLSAGNRRSATKRSRIMIHQPSGGTEGNMTDIHEYSKRLSKTNDELISILSVNCIRDKSKIKKDIERDYYMSASEALEYGIIDNII